LVGDGRLVAAHLADCKSLRIPEMETYREHLARIDREMREAYGTLAYTWLFRPWFPALVGLAVGAAFFATGMWFGKHFG
jgi:hypothetical protein